MEPRGATVRALDRARWEADELRDFVRRYVVAGLDDGGGGPGPGGVFPCRVGVMADWATSRGQALVDRELYLPREWTSDRARCRAAHVPDEVGFATKPRLAEKMIARIVPDLPQGAPWTSPASVFHHGSAGW